MLLFNSQGSVGTVLTGSIGSFVRKMAFIKEMKARTRLSNMEKGLHQGNEARTRLCNMEKGLHQVNEGLNLVEKHEKWPSSSQ